MNPHEGKTQAWRKVMAAYRRGMTACTPGSAPGPTLGNEYGRTFTLPVIQHLLANTGVHVWRRSLDQRVRVNTFRVHLVLV